MENTNLVCICVPVYKKELSPLEQLSLKQLRKVLGQYPIKFVGPKEVAEYYSDFQFESFDSHFFSGIPGYNQLLLSKKFYSKFLEYEYLLIYQLDAYVFEDSLKEWCAKGYDYVGAPWFENFEDHHDKADLWAVGNGGLSLRKVSSMLKILNQKDRFYSRRDLLYMVRNQKGFGAKEAYKLYFKEPNSLPALAKAYAENEDIFWGVEVAKKTEWYKVPSVHEALQFSFECDPKFLFELNKNKLPFGCHAFEKYDTDFWSAHIEGLQELV